MTGRLTRRAGGALCAALVLVGLAACGETVSDSEQSDTGEDGVMMGPGVTEDKISIGAIIDLSGPFSPVGRTYRQGAQLYFDQLNEEDGICGRQVEYVVQDYGLDTQRGVTAYESMREDVIGLEDVQGGPLMSAILADVERDEMLASPVTWTADLLESESVLMVGPTYEVQVANGVDFMAEEEGLSDGATVGVIRHEGTYGEAVLIGAQDAGERLGFRTIDRPVDATDVDLTAEIQALESEGAELIVLGTASRQVASAVSAAVASDYGVPFLGASPGIWDPGLLETSVGDELEQRVLIATGEAPYSSPEPGPARVRELHERENPNGPTDFGITYGYAQAQVFTDVLEAACEEKDLTRAGVLEARRGLTSVDTEGLVVELDFSRLGTSPSQQSYLLRPDSEEPGGLAVASEVLTASE